MPNRSRTPLRCPVCQSQLEHEQIIPLGAVTANVPWEMHAGRCPEHGWFQAEVVSKPPREIFPVTRPGGVARPFRVDGHVAYAFPTVWSTQNTLRKVDPYDATFWQVDWSRLPGNTVTFEQAS